MYPSLLTIFAFALALGWAGGPASAESLENPDAIRAAIEAAAAQIGPSRDQSLEVEVGNIDPRIHVAACPALEVDIPAIRSPYMSARVACRAPFWTLFVPLRVHAWSHAVVAATNLAPGTKLAANDLTVARLDVLGTNGAYLSDPREAEGMILRANVRAGAPILAPLLDRPTLVHRGDTVVLTVRDGAITIRAGAVAMEDGHVGDHILVQNPDSRKTVRAAVTDAGSVVIRLDQAAENER